MAFFQASGQGGLDLPSAEVSEEDAEIISEGIEVVKPKDVRVSFGMVEGERLFYCPYNRSHQILDSKWNSHLGKCRRNGLKAANWDEDKLQVQPCKYEPNIHHIPKRLMPKHLEWCRSRDHIEAITSAIRNVSMISAEKGEAITMDASVGPLSDESNATISFGNSDSGIEVVKGVGEEDWDKGSLKEVSASKEEEPASKLKFLYRTPHGLTKSERKKFRQEVALEVAANGGLGTLLEKANASTPDVEPKPLLFALDDDSIEDASSYDTDTYSVSSDSGAIGDKSDLDW